MAKRRRRRKKEKPRHWCRTADGSGVFPSHLSKMMKIKARCAWLLDDRKTSKFVHPEVEITWFRSGSYVSGLAVTFIFDDGRVPVLSTDVRGEFTFVDKDHLDECLDFLEREQVLEGLAEI
jgi:hypothetical protein